MASCEPSVQADCLVFGKYTCAERDEGRRAAAGL